MTLFNLEENWLHAFSKLTNKPVKGQKWSRKVNTGSSWSIWEQLTLRHAGFSLFLLQLLLTLQFNSRKGYECMHKAKQMCTVPSLKTVYKVKEVLTINIRKKCSIKLKQTIVSVILLCVKASVLSSIDGCWVAALQICQLEWGYWDVLNTGLNRINRGTELCKESRFCFAPWFLNFFFFCLHSNTLVSKNEHRSANYIII